MFSRLCYFIIAILSIVNFNNLSADTSKDDLKEYNFYYDLDFNKSEIINQFIISSYDKEVSNSIVCALEYLLRAYDQSKSDKKTEINFLNIINYDLSELSIFKDVKDEDFRALMVDIYHLANLMGCLTVNNMYGANKEALDIKNKSLKNLGIYLVFNHYLEKNDLDRAESAFLKLEQDDTDVELSDAAKMITLGYLKDSLFQKAQVFAYSILDEKARDLALSTIVKFYARIGDIDNAHVFIDSISDKTNKYIALLYILDAYVRERNFSDFRKIVDSIKEKDFQKAALDVLNLELDNFREVRRNLTENDDYRRALLNNFIEILLTKNNFDKAVNVFEFYLPTTLDEIKLYFVNIYLKNKDNDNATKIADGIQNAFEKWVALKLISIHPKTK